MPDWIGSDRHGRLPPNWKMLRRRTLHRDGHRCTAVSSTGQRCDEPATEVDHIEPGDNHDPSNLRALCTWHHRRKSSQEGGRARAARYRQRNRFRRDDPHPGLLE
ncbi:hypothetical protein GCM10010124_02100 [Pilimelia terevasa]|uniref:HNH nuclease domain-containing protein n=1 Tax=Pilimelia terevasa TaxID=53372 RepID=A0A8J3BLW2_9ACTN|nr:HNH endonuclease signature motif containing protein [Pilimelia terevasa]GGK13130.1 hypothetical protein GCM10010124_02100 [Pilimelia terevasa]